MEKRITEKNYVKTDTNMVLVQVPDDNEFGFSLCDDDQSWPGGFGVARRWEIIPESEVPDEDRERLGWIFDID